MYNGRGRGVDALVGLDYLPWIPLLGLLAVLVPRAQYRTMNMEVQHFFFLYFITEETLHS